MYLLCMDNCFHDFMINKGVKTKAGELCRDKPSNIVQFKHFTFVNLTFTVVGLLNNRIMLCILCTLFSC